MLGSLTQLVVYKAINDNLRLWTTFAGILDLFWNKLKDTKNPFLKMPTLKEIGDMKSALKMALNAVTRIKKQMSYAET